MEQRKGYCEVSSFMVTKIILVHICLINLINKDYVEHTILKLNVKNYLGVGIDLILTLIITIICCLIALIVEVFHLLT